MWNDRENKETTIDLDVLIDTDLTGFKQTDTKLNLKCSIFRNLFNVTPEFTDVN